MSDAADHDTLKFYRANAETYAQRQPRGTEQMTGFLAALPPGGSILELGCGAGYQAAQMLAAGFDVHPTDGSAEMAAQAQQRLGREVRTMLFHELDADAAYDGVWAYACLLHVPRDELASVLSRVWRALKPGGWFYASFKSGEGEGRDKLARYYNYPSEEWLRARYAEAGGWASIDVARDQGKGFDGELASFLHVMVQKQS
ncbi:class I SAM-dependent methyltransferase [Rhodopseudomonas palustris]|uniref:Methyltransferase domain-containing protein n=1 Tax=Rhodopseudomonas palustris (strain BisB18) TaxID=316056 RepID=Q213R6_RHOPB